MLCLVWWWSEKRKREMGVVFCVLCLRRWGGKRFVTFTDNVVKRNQDWAQVWFECGIFGGPTVSCGIFGGQVV